MSPSTPQLNSSPASGLGLASYAGEELLDVWYPQPSLTREPEDVPGLGSAIALDPIREVRIQTIRTVIDDLSEPPRDTADVYLRLHLLSHRLVAPRTINLDGVFGLLPNNAWTNLGPVPVADMQETRLRARTKGNNSRSSGSTSSPHDRLRRAKWSPNC